MQDMAFSIIVVFNLHSLGFSPQLLFAEVLGSELLLLRFFSSSFRGVVLGPECSFSPRFSNSDSKTVHTNAHLLDLENNCQNEPGLAILNVDTADNGPKVNV